MQQIGDEAYYYQGTNVDCKVVCGVVSKILHIVLMYKERDEQVKQKKGAVSSL